jgi:hypothetical protein
MHRTAILFAVFLAACVVKTTPDTPAPSEPATAEPTPAEPTPGEPAPAAQQIGCVATGGNIAGGQTGAEERVSCPAGCLEKGPVWGNGLYTRDSRVCQAAIHAGVIDDGGGTFTVRLTDGASVFSGSEANGVTTNDGGANPRAFRVSQ